MSDGVFYECCICQQWFKPLVIEMFGHEYLLRDKNGHTTLCRICFDRQVEKDALRLHDIPDGDYIIQHGNAFEWKHGGFLE